MLKTFEMQEFKLVEHGRRSRKEKIKLRRYRKVREGRVKGLSTQNQIIEDARDQ